MYFVLAGVVNLGWKRGGKSLRTRISIHFLSCLPQIDLHMKKNAYGRKMQKLAFWGGKGGKFGVVEG